MSGWLLEEPPVKLLLSLGDRESEWEEVNGKTLGGMGDPQREEEGGNGLREHGEEGVVHLLEKGKEKDGLSHLLLLAKADRVRSG